MLAYGLQFVFDIIIAFHGIAVCRIQTNFNTVFVYFHTLASMFLILLLNFYALPKSLLFLLIHFDSNQLRDFVPLLIVVFLVLLLRQLEQRLPLHWRFAAVVVENAVATT